MPSRRAARERLPRVRSSSSSAQNVKVALTVKYGQSTPKLLEKCVAGLLLPAVQLHSMPARGGRQTYVKYELTNVQITSFEVHAPGHGPRPKGVTLNYAAVQFVLSAEVVERSVEGSQ